MFVRLLLLAALIVTVGFAPAPFPRTQRHEPKRALIDQMQGWWAHTEEVSGGQPSALFGLRVHIEGKKLQYYVNQGKADGWTIEVDPSEKPPCLDKLSINSKDYKLLGRVSVEGDTMKLGWVSNTERPADLTGRRGRAITFKRERK